MSSQDLSSQLKKQLQETQALEQRASHSQSEVQAAQQKLKQLDRDIEARTEQLLAKQQEQLDLAKGKADKALQAVTDEIISREKQLKAVDLKSTAMNHFYEDIVAQKKIAQGELIAIDDLVERAKTELKLTNKFNNNQIEANKVLETKTAEAKGHLKDLEESIIKTEERKTQVEFELSTLESDYEVKKTEKELKITQLDSRIVELATTLDERRKEELITRSDLAIMSKALEERDRNLRIREEKVNQGENKLVQNSSLLNL